MKSGVNPQKFIETIVGYNGYSPSKSIKEYRDTFLNIDLLIIKELEDLSFAPPVWGKISKKFSDNMPLYSKTMDDWRIHVGVDILCPLGSDIFSAGDGVVADIGYDINLGDYITVESNEFATRYASVVPDELVTIGTTVSKGQKLGILADSCVSEICDESHLHFEMKKDGIYIDPAEHILFE